MRNEMKMKEKERSNLIMKIFGKKQFAVLAALLVAVMIGTASAETIAPLPARIDLDHLCDRFVTTDIEYQGNGIATLTLFEDERFDAEALRALKEGDVIVSDGEETAVVTIEWDGPDLFVNRNTETEMLFCETGDEEFEHVYYQMDDRIPQVKLGSMDQEILPYMTMLDWVDAETGEVLEQVAVRDGEALLKLLEEDNGPSFSVRNVRILYDNNNQPVLIWRYYSPAQ